MTRARVGAPSPLLAVRPWPAALGTALAVLGLALAPVYMPNPGDVIQATQLRITPELRPSAGNNLFVFALPE